MNIRECYDLLGADYEDVLRRIGNEDRAKRFLLLFTKDESYQNLCVSLENNDAKEAFRAAHSLKGICLNLGMKSLLAPVLELTESLRGEKITPESLQFFNSVGQVYAQTMDTIGKFFNP